MYALTRIGRCDLSRSGLRNVPEQNLGIEFSCRMATLAERQRALQASTKLTGFAGKPGKPRGCATLIESGRDHSKVRLVVE